MTGLVYVRARWYDPNTGTFLSPDPLGYNDSSNLYAFAGGDPVNGRDPRGELVESAVAPMLLEGGAGTAAARNPYTAAVVTGLLLNVFIHSKAAEIEAEADLYVAQQTRLQRRIRREAEERKKRKAVPQLPVTPDISPYKQQRQTVNNPAAQQQLDAYHNASPEGMPVSSASDDRPCQQARPIDSPVYSVYIRVRVSDTLYPNRSDKAHFQDANRQLYEYMQQHPDFANALEREHPGITEFLRPGARGAFPRQTPSDYGLTWHHEPTEPGLLELIPIDQHRAPGPIQRSLHPDGCGGMETWGGGRKRRLK